MKETLKNEKREILFKYYKEIQVYKSRKTNMIEKNQFIKDI